MSKVHVVLNVHYYNQYCVERPCAHIFVTLINLSGQNLDMKFPSQRFGTYLRLSYLLPNSVPEKNCAFALIPAAMGTPISRSPNP